MKPILLPTRIFAVLFAALLAMAGSAKAALVLTISEFTSTHITVTVSGTLDADTSGVHNAGAFFVAPTSDLTIPWYTGSLAIVLDTMTVGGAAAAGTAADNNGFKTGYSLYWGQAAPWGFGEPGFSVAAGTAVSGTIRATGNIHNMDFYATDFKLYSGQPSPRVAGRLETTAVPEPTSALLCGISALGLLARRRR